MKDMLKNSKVPAETEMAVPIVLLKEANLLNVGDLVVKCTPGAIIIKKMCGENSDWVWQPILKRSVYFILLKFDKTKTQLEMNLQAVKNKN